MTAGRSPVELLDTLDALRAEPERTCQWCMARPGEWCESDCANPERRCHPSYVAHYAAERGAYSDADAELIVAAVDHLPALVAALRAVLDLAEELAHDQTEGARIAGRTPCCDASDRIRAAVTAALTEGGQA